MDVPSYRLREDDVGWDDTGPMSSASSSSSKLEEWRFYPMLVVKLVALMIGLIGNGLLVHMFATQRGMRTTANTFILSIAVTDLLVTASCPAAIMLNDLVGYWPLGSTACKATQAVMEFSNCATVLALTALSVERYYVIVHPLDQITSNRRFSAFVIYAIWITSVLFSIPKFINSDLRLEPRGNTSVTICVFNAEGQLVKNLSLFGLFAFYVIPLCVVVVMYTIVYRHLATETLATKRRSVHQEQMRNKVSRMVFALTAIFFVSFLPYNLLRIQIFLFGGATGYWDNPEAEEYSYCFGCMHFWLNPITLYLFCDAIRKNYNSYFACHLGFRRIEGDTTTSTQQSEKQETTVSTVASPT